MGAIEVMMESLWLRPRSKAGLVPRLTHLAALVAVLLLTPVGSPLAVERDEVYYAPLLGLLTTPERFEGRALRVMGFLKFNGELRIYLTRDHAEISDRQSSIVVVDTTDDASLTESTCPSNYVSVTGEFKRFPDGSFGLINIREVVNRSDLDACWVTSEPE